MKKIISIVGVMVALSIRVSNQRCVYLTAIIRVEREKGIANSAAGIAALTGKVAWTA